jgi:curved DNA-binding protein CbpA
MLSAYKVKALAVHPDKCTHRDAGEAFVRLQAALECLLDPVEWLKHFDVSDGKTKSSGVGTAGDGRKTREEFAAAMKEDLDRHVAAFRARQKRRSEIISAREAAYREEMRADFESEEGAARSFQRTSAWQTWRAGAQKRRRDDVTKYESVKPSGMAEDGMFTCTVCRRGFRSEAGLAKHCSDSELHKTNLVKQNEG